MGSETREQLRAIKVEIDKNKREQDTGRSQVSKRSDVDNDRELQVVVGGFPELEEHKVLEEID
eukprot:2194319-Karenia_brevis.AAC.1